MAGPPRVDRTQSAPHLSHAIGVDVIQATPHSTPDDFIRKVLDRGVDQLCEALRKRCADNETLPLPALIESPLEAAFYRLWTMHGCLQDTHRASFRLDPQIIVLSAYRVDFKVTLVSCAEVERLASFPLICVELDGHDYHETTKEQATRRNVRDRDLMAAGWKIIRFSGSEFYRSPLACVEEVYVFAVAALQTLLATEYRRRQGVA
jgi:very-short-patch-repair endonuclease